MAKLFGLGGETPDNSAQLAMQKRQQRRIDEQAGEEQREMGARRRLMTARASGNSATLFGSPAGVAQTLGG